MGVLWKKLWFDLWVRKTRTLLVIISIAAGVFAVGTVFGMNDQLVKRLDQAHQLISTCFSAAPLDKTWLLN